MASSQRLSTVVVSTTKASSTPYVCASCRTSSRIVSRKSPNRQQIRHKSELPFTERIRRKIWGTDNPPGLKDPYGGPSFLEKRLARRRLEQEQAGLDSSSSRPTEFADPDDELVEDEEVAVEPIVTEPVRLLRPRVHLRPDKRATINKKPTLDEPYEPAETWDGLDWVGNLGDYKHTEPAEADSYEPWLRKGGEKYRGSIWKALHEAVFDAVQPKSEQYDPDCPIAISEQGFVTAAEGSALSSEETTAEDVDGTTHAIKSFANAQLGFRHSAAHTFKIIKNFQILTLIKVPDAVLSRLAADPSSTYNDLVHEIEQLQEPKPLKVHEHLLASVELRSQPNVRIATKKLSKQDKEKAMGRWKVIQSELRKRGLPIPGERFTKPAALRGAAESEY